MDSRRLFLHDPLHRFIGVSFKAAEARPMVAAKVVPGGKEWADKKKPIEFHVENPLESMTRGDCIGRCGVQ
jgi:hypothetical protein